MRRDFLGFPLDALTMDETIAACEKLMGEGRFAHHVSVNAGKVVASRRDGELARIMRAADISSADGQSVVWAARVLGSPVPERVAGIDLADRLASRCAALGLPVYLLGARREVVEKLAESAPARWPGIRLAGWRDGYFTDDADVATAVADSGARLLLLALPSPRKETFLDAQRDRLGPLLAIGVGGSFDVWTGLTRRAPAWMQRSGLEWLYRFAQEPRRMWKRYLVGNAVFLGVVLAARLRRPFRRSGEA